MKNNYKLKTCPICKLIVFQTADHCDCGYHFETGEINKVYIEKQKMEKKENKKFVNQLVFCFLLVFEISLSLFLIPIQMESYKNIQPSKIAVVFIFPIFLALFFLFFINILHIIINIYKKNRMWFYSTLVLVVSIFIFYLPNYLLPQTPYEEVRYQKITNQTNDERFNELLALYESQFHPKYITILTEKENVVIDNTVINLDSLTFGPVPEFGMFYKYYENAKINKAISLQAIFKENKLNIKVEQFYRLYDLMLELGISDLDANKTNPEIIEIMWNNSGYSGSRGIYYAATIDTTTVRALYDDLEIIRQINPNMVYFKRKPYAIF